MKSLVESIHESLLVENNDELITLLRGAVADFDARYPFYGDKWKPEAVKDFFKTLPGLEGGDELIKHMGGWVIARQDWDTWEETIKNNFLSNKYNSYLGKVTSSDLDKKEWFLIKYRDRSDACKIPCPFLLYFDDKKLCKDAFDYLKSVKSVAPPKKTSDYDADFKKYQQERENNRPNVWE